MKKDLKQTIFETVSKVRNLFIKLKNNCDEKSSKVSKLEAEVTKAKTEQEGLTNKAVNIHETRSVNLSREPVGPKEHGVPSVIPSQEPADPIEHGATSVIPRQVPVGPREHGTPLFIPSQEPPNPKERGATSIIPRQVPAGLRVREEAPSIDPERERKLYSQALGNKTFRKKFKLTVK